MRKLALLITLTVASVLSLAAAPSPASAANCAGVATTGTTWQPAGLYNLKFSVQLGSCTSDVDQVQFSQCPVAGGGVAAGWVDGAVWHACNAPGTYTSSIYTCVPIACDRHSEVYTYYGWCWYSGASRVIAPRWQFRIHNSNWGGSWGSWTLAYGANQNVAC